MPNLLLYLFEKAEELYTSIAFGIVLLVFVVIVFIMSIIRYKRRIFKDTVEKIEMQREFEQQLLQSQLEIQEETLKHISEEIHDNIGQVLSLAKLHLNVFPQQATAADQNIVGETKNLVSKAINDLRNLSKSLHPDRINQLGIEESLKHELDILKRTGLYESIYKVEGKPYKLPAEKQVIIFRIFQEGLNNIIKHALASKVELQLLYEAGQFILVLTDNGKGIDKTEINNGIAGIGVTSMNHRAHMIGALLKIENGALHGTTLTLEVPVN